MKRRDKLRPTGMFALAFIGALAYPHTRPTVLSTVSDVLSSGKPAAAATRVAGVHRPRPGRPVHIPGGCRTLTDQQLAGLVSSVWPASQRRMAFTVALAESGGRTCAVGDVALQRGDWGPSVCLWQMRSKHSQRGTGGVRDQAANLASATTCARHARQLQAAEGWRPWSTYNHGSYKGYIVRAVEVGL